MSFHPNDVARRARTASFIAGGIVVFLVAAFFRTQVLDRKRYALQSEENRLREVPLPAPRGIIFDRNGRVIAENVPGYSVSILSPSSDSLRAALQRLAGTIQLTPSEIELAVRRYRRAPNRPTVILGDAKFDVVSVLEEHRVEFPGLIIQAAPKRFYPDSTAVASIVGYTGEVTEDELKRPQYEGYKAGQQVGKGGLERYYESQLRGREGTRFVEVDARGRVVREAGARQDIEPLAAEPLQTNIDLPLQEFTAKLFGDSLQGGVVALDPQTGGVLALYSAPSYNPNRFVGGIPVDYWRELNTDPRRPLYNKAIQGTYPPGSTWKLATAAVALESGVVTMNDHMPVPCTGGYQYFNRYFRCWEPRGHGNVNLQQAIEKSCDVYFYQLGLKMTLERLIAGGVSLSFRERTGIDLPSESRPIFPSSIRYYDERYGPRGWTRAATLSLAIGQGENSQTVVNMARFYTALATDGSAAQPMIAKGTPKRQKLFTLTPEQMLGLRTALAGVVGAGGTAASAQIRGVVLAGKTGTAQNSQDPLHHHAWFVGFAPADNPKIVVAVMLEFGGHGTRAARIASSIISEYLQVVPTTLLETEGE
ncbi:MAG TPA: penicillin-binding protein 2 [Gemmatimonadaceae bacterium]|nr:penicillin-binding protein 2 [Gemmatimonadaceae bacterium]